MAGFSNLAQASQYLDDALRSAYVGMVPCSAVGQFEDGTEKWEEIVNAKIKEVKLLNSKAILVNASLQKGSLQNVSADRDAALEELSKSLDSRLRWGKALQVQAVSNAVYYGRWSPQNSLLMKDLLGRLSELQRYLDSLERLEAERWRELSAAAGDWQRGTVEFAEKRRANLAKKKAERPTNETLVPIIDKLELMRVIMSKLMVASQTYDWTKDRGDLLKLLPKIRREKFTPESFL